ncbi:unnamed protein product [Parajaminaea phylloscopi]
MLAAVSPASRRLLRVGSRLIEGRSIATTSTTRQTPSATASQASQASHTSQASQASQASVDSIYSQARTPPPPLQHRTANQDGAAALPTVALEDRVVRVTWFSGIESRFHHIWLRDHCRCPTCYHPKTKQRLLDTFAIPRDVHPLSVEATTEGLEVIWPRKSAGTEPESHASLYPWKWLRNHSYAPPLDQSHATSVVHREDLAGANKTLWGRGIAANPPTVAYDEVMQDDRGVLKWLEKIWQYGFSFVDGLPATPEATEELIKRIAFIRETHYGGFWDFTSDLSHGDTAYTDIALGAHTDTTYFTDPAGLQMFHLLSHTASSQGAGPSGGASLLVDGFLAAKVLRDVHPEAYEVLSSTRISTHSAGDESTLVRPLLKGGYPILEHDAKTGRLVMVRYNNDDRSTLKVDEGAVEPFYDALHKWHEVITSPEGEYWEQLVPGRALVFDNHRVLHGRSSFVGNRRLCGAYVNHDDYRSRLAVLRSRYGEGGGREARGVWDDGL